MLQPTDVPQRLRTPWRENYAPSNCRCPFASSTLHHSARYDFARTYFRPPLELIKLHYWYIV